MKLLGDLPSPALMYLKAFLFLVAGCLAVAGVFLQNPSVQNALLLWIAVWSFCRLYYFMFYVVEKYTDPGFRFDGIFSFLAYLLRKRKQSGR